jgi:uncharacterized protein YbcV (DUF1398 family)
MENETFEEYWLKNAGVLRYGQAFCNYYSIQNPTLYYETDEVKAREQASLYIADWQLSA